MVVFGCILKNLYSEINPPSRPIIGKEKIKKKENE